MIMRKKKTAPQRPDLKEFIDDDGSKWIQTSPEDIFSTREFNEMLNNLDKDEDENDVVLARIDFQKVNREYYEAALELRKRLHQQNKVLKQVLTQTREIVERKNIKLRELIEYIRKLHAIMESAPEGEMPKIVIPAEKLQEREKRAHVSEYVPVEELPFDPSVDSGL